MGARTKARKAALDLLFEADQRGLNAADLLAARLAAPGPGPVIREYTATLVSGVVERWTAINDALTTYSHGWTLDRMPAVDRSVLRLGAYEVLFSQEVPAAVAIAEAVSLAKDLSTADSASFVNGLLARLDEAKPTLV